MTKTKTRPNRAVLIRCVVCGLEVVGVKNDLGIVRPSDTSRPAIDAPIESGYCIQHAPE